MPTQQIVQHRRDSYANYAPSKLKPGEIVMVQSGDPNSSSGRAVYACISAGVVERLATQDELSTYDQAAQSAAQAAEDAKTSVISMKEQINTDLASAQAAVQSAIAAKTAAENIESQVESSSTAAQAAADAAESTAAGLATYASAAQTAAQNAQSAETNISAIKDQIEDSITDFEAEMTTLKSQVDLELENARAAAENAAELKDDVLALKTQAESAVSSAQSAAQDAQEALESVQSRAEEIDAVLDRRTREIDVGSGVTDLAGAAYVYLSSDFQAALGGGAAYRVFLQEEGEGKLHVREKTNAFFAVGGTASLTFAWMAVI